MTAPAVPAAIRVSQPSARPRVDRAGTLVEFWFRAHSALVYAFLYVPIVVVVLFAFNDTDGASSRFQGSASAGSRSP